MPDSKFSIPNPPRNVRWRTCLARRWLVGLVGCILTLHGILIPSIFLLTGFGRPFRDATLDTDARAATGTITGVREVDHGWFGTVHELVFRFAAPGVGELTGRSYIGSPSDTMAVGNACTVEFVPGSPHINRVKGTFCTFFPTPLKLILTVLLSTGILCAYVWFRAALRLRIALREGELVEADILEYTLLRYLSPRTLWIRYRFRDGTGTEHISAHCVRATSRLGRHLLEDQPRHHAAIHDKDDPRISRLVSAEDFVALELP